MIQVMRMSAGDEVIVVACNDSTYIVKFIEGTSDHVCQNEGKTIPFT